MPAVTINTVPFAGTIFDLESVLRAPVEAKPVWIPITNILVGRDGTRNTMRYGGKWRFVLTWKLAPQHTRDVLAQAAMALTTPFAYIHIDSLTYTVQLETESDYDESVAAVFPNGNRYYDLTFTMHQG